MRYEPQDTCGGPCWPRKPEFGGAGTFVRPLSNGAQSALVFPLSDP
jgi:hypothetical protein